MKQLADELSEVARARNRLELQPALFPCLARRADVATMDSIFESIDGAIAQLDHGPQLAATCLLADTPERWTQNLKSRSTAAAGHLGIGSYHTFRDRRGGSSPSDDLLTAVAERLLAEPGHDHAATGSAEPGNTASAKVLESQGRRSFGVPMVLAAVALVAAVGAATILMSADDAALEESVALDGGADPEAPTSSLLATTITSIDEADTSVEPDGGTVGGSEALPVPGCDIPLGGSVTPTPNQREVAQSIADAVEVAGGVDKTGCPLHSVERWQGLWVQAFIGADLPPGSVLVGEDGNGVWVEEGVVVGYRSGMSGTLQQVSGLPVDFRVDGQVQILELSDGAFVVAEVPGNRAFWIAQEAADDWLAAGGAAGGLGAPMTDPNFIDGRPEQHFRNGRIWEGAPGEAIVEIFDADAVADYLSGLGDPSERLVRTFDSTAWWIDADGVRRWIPDGATWNCVGGSDVVLEEETPGWVIGSFPIGPPMSCD